MGACRVSNTFLRVATIPARGEGRSGAGAGAWAGDIGGPAPPCQGPPDKKDETPDKRGQLGDLINSLLERESGGVGAPREESCLPPSSGPLDSPVLHWLSVPGGAAG